MKCEKHARFSLSMWFKLLKIYAKVAAVDFRILKFRRYSNLNTSITWGFGSISLINLCSTGWITLSSESRMCVKLHNFSKIRSRITSNSLQMWLYNIYAKHAMIEFIYFEFNKVALSEKITIFEIHRLQRQKNPLNKAYLMWKKNKKFEPTESRWLSNNRITFKVYTLSAPRREKSRL